MVCVLLRFCQIIGHPVSYTLLQGFGEKKDWKTNLSKILFCPNKNVSSLWQVMFDFGKPLNNGKEIAFLKESENRNFVAEFSHRVMKKIS